MFLEETRVGCRISAANALFAVDTREGDTELERQAKMPIIVVDNCRQLTQILTVGTW